MIFISSVWIKIKERVVVWEKVVGDCYIILDSQSFIIGMYVFYNNKNCEII